MGTREAYNALFRVWVTKSINGKVVQMVLWESDQFIVVMKPRNGGGAKGLAGKSLGRGHILHTQKWKKNVNKTLPITYLEVGRFS